MHRAESWEHCVGLRGWFASHSVLQQPRGQKHLQREPPGCLAQGSKVPTRWDWVGFKTVGGGVVAGDPLPHSRERKGSLWSRLCTCAPTNPEGVGGRHRGNREKWEARTLRAAGFLPATPSPGPRKAGAGGMRPAPRPRLRAPPAPRAAPDPGPPAARSAGTWERDERGRGAGPPGGGLWRGAGSRPWKPFPVSLNPRLRGTSEHSRRAASATTDPDPGHLLRPRLGRDVVPSCLFPGRGRAGGHRGERSALSACFLPAPPVRPGFGPAAEGRGAPEGWRWRWSRDVGSGRRAPAPAVGRPAPRPSARRLPPGRPAPPTPDVTPAPAAPPPRSPRRLAPPPAPLLGPPGPSLLRCPRRRRPTGRGRADSGGLELEGRVPRPGAGWCAQEEDPEAGSAWACLGLFRAGLLPSVTAQIRGDFEILREPPPSPGRRGLEARAACRLVPG